MPFLQEGDSDVITIPAGQSIAVGAPVDSSANVLIPLGLRGGPVSVVTSATQTFGPYPNGATIIVFAARGQVEYQIGTSPVVASSVSLAASTTLVSGIGVPWANRVAPSVAGIGAQFWADLGNSRPPALMRSDGTNWRPVNGQIQLLRAVGSVATPIATYVGNGAAQFFTISNNRIPANLIIPGSRLYGEVLTRRIGAGGVATTGRVGISTTNGYPSGSEFLVNTVQATDLFDSRYFGTANFSSATSFIRNGIVIANSAATNAYSDQSSGVNTAQDMFVNIGTDGMTVDTYALLAYSFWLEF